MQSISITTVKTLPNRQRREFLEADLHKLADSIQRLGLLHAPVLRKEAGDLILVAGERRTRVMRDLHDLEIPFTYNGEPVPQGHIPYTLFEDLDPLAAMEAELEENTHRTDLTWQERAQAVAQLRDLREQQALASGQPLPTVADLALEVRGSAEGVNQANTRKELILAKHLDNPNVREAKSVKEAFKILVKEEATRKNKALGEKIGKTYSAASHQALNEDSTLWMSKCGDNLYDVILTDPPYGMSADEFGDSGGVAEGAHGYKDDYETFMRCATAIAFDGYRIAKEQAHAYVFCDFDKFSQLKALMQEAGWWVFRTPLIWYKPQGMRAPWPEHGPQRKYETILYAVKGKRPVLKMAPDLITCPTDANLGHAAQKPVALFEDLLKRSCSPGDTVLDPFCGSGPIFAAATTLQCYATGIELDPASYGIAVKRIEGLMK